MVLQYSLGGGVVAQNGGKVLSPAFGGWIARGVKFFGGQIGGSGFGEVQHAVFSAGY
jgi:hypothetical protein